MGTSVARLTQPKTRSAPQPKTQSAPIKLPEVGLRPEDWAFYFHCRLGAIWLVTERRVSPRGLGYLLSLPSGGNLNGYLETARGG